jgi:CheY-like chemotaxis protein
MEEAAMARESADKRVRVLVVEDIDTTRNMYVRNLELHSDYRVEAAADLAEATEALDALTFHVAVVDIMLAGPKDTANRDGTKVLDRIRELDEGTRAVVLSAQEEPQQVREFMKQHDAFDYLEKDELLKTGIGKMLEYVSNAAEDSRVGCEPSWDTVVGALAGRREEPIFVSEVMGALKFGGGFENLQRTLTAVVRYLAPLVPALDGDRGLVFDEERGVLAARYWSKGQGCAIEFVVSGRESEGRAEGASSQDGALTEREKGGLRVAALRRDDSSREEYADSAR